MHFARVRRPSLVLALLAVLAGCKSLGLDPASPARNLTGFDEVEVLGRLTAEISVGDRFLVTVTGDQKLARQVETRVEDQTLLVTTRQEGDTRLAERVRVRVVLPALARLQAHGARVTVTGAATERLEVEAQKGATVTVDAIAAQRLVVEAIEGSRVVLVGSAESFQCALAQASRADARQLEVRTARVSVADASRLDLRPRTALSGEASGASRVAVWSKPRRVRVATRDEARVTYVP